MCPRWAPSASFAWFFILIVWLYLFLQHFQRHGGTDLFKSMRNSFVEGQIWDHPSKMIQKRPRLGAGEGMEAEQKRNKIKYFLVRNPKTKPGPSRMAQTPRAGGCAVTERLARSCRAPPGADFGRFATAAS